MERIFKQGNLIFEEFSTCEFAIGPAVKVACVEPSPTIIIPEKVTDEDTGVTYSVVAIDRIKRSSGGYYTQRVEDKRYKSGFRTDRAGSYDATYYDNWNGVKNIYIPTTIKSISYIRSNTLESIQVGKPKSFFAQLFAEKQVKGKIAIPEGIEVIGEHAFEGCESLTSVSIPDSVTYIKHEAFKGCSSLTSVTIPEGVTKIEWHSFNGCDSLKSVIIPNSVTEIEHKAFRYCEKLSSITIPNGVTRIGDEAFDGCRSLTSVTIPNSVRVIGVKAFDNWRTKNIIIQNIEKNVTLRKEWCKPEKNYWIANVKFVGPIED